MAQQLVVRIAQASLSLLAVIVIVFAISRFTGDPVQLLLPPEASGEQYAFQRERLGIDQSLINQYIRYMSDIFRGDLGTSIRTNRPVTEMIIARIPATLELGAAALLLTFALGIPLGIYAAYWKGRRFDTSVRMFAVLGQAAPAFWVGILLVLLFSVVLGWFPTGGRGSLAHVILPAITLAWANIAGVTRLMRSSMLETFETDYIRFCRIKGLPERRILWKHSFRNAGLPVLTFGGVLVATLITGSIATEVVFAWPGVGSLLIEGIRFRDFPMVQGGVLILAAVYVVMSLLVDMAYTYLNPRLRMR